MRALPVGFAVGIMSGLLGIGGGALLIVGLVWLGYRQHAAHATSLAGMVLTATGALVPFALHGEVAVRAGLLLAVGSLTGAYVGAGIMRRIPEGKLRIAFVAFIFVIAVRMLLGVESPPGPAVVGGGASIGLLALGLVVGVLSAIMGVGGGLIFVPALVLLFGFSQHAAEGTSLAVVVPTALMGAWRHSRSGFTAWRTGMILGAAGVAGGVGGAYLALWLEGVTLQRIFAVFLFVMGIRLLRSKSK